MLSVRLRPTTPEDVPHVLRHEGETELLRHGPAERHREELSAHRLYVDVMEHNARARGLYLSEGFVPEGVLRDGVRLADRYASLLLLSMLEYEYARNKSKRTDARPGD